MPEVIQLEVTERQRDTILAALRYYQNPEVDLGEMIEISTNGGAHPYLTRTEIDQLIEELNPWPQEVES